MAQKVIDRELRKLPPGTILVHGACRGADNIAGYVGQHILDFDVRPYPVGHHEWKMQGPRAGILRNQRMLDCEHTEAEPIDKVLAFHEDPDLGKGTRDMVARAEKAGIPYEVFSR